MCVACCRYASRALLKLEKKWTVKFQKVDKDDPEAPTEDQVAEHAKSFNSDLQKIESSANAFLKAQDELPKYMKNLIKPYDFRAYWFETFECLRKICLTGITIFFPQGSVEQLVVALVLCVFLSWVYHNKKPYRSDEDDILAAVCQASVFVSIVSRIVLQYPTFAAESRLCSSNNPPSSCRARQTHT